MLLCLVVFVESINLLAIRKHFALIFFRVIFCLCIWEGGVELSSCQLLSSLHPFKRKFSMRVRHLYLKLRYTIYSMNRLLVYLQGGTISNAISLTFCLCLCQCAENILTNFAIIRNVVWSWMHATRENCSAFLIGGFINITTVMKWENSKNWWNRRRIDEKGHRGSRTNTSSQQWHSTSLFHFSSSFTCTRSLSLHRLIAKYYNQRERQ